MIVRKLDNGQRKFKNGHRKFTLGKFKEKIKFWTTDKCPCRLCKTYIGNVGFI